MSQAGFRSVTLKTFGAGESAIEERLGDLFGPLIPASPRTPNATVSTCGSPPADRALLRLSASSTLCSTTLEHTWLCGLLRLCR